MLTVKQINEVSFGKAGFSGYKPEDVDQFIDEVVDSFRQLESERDDAVKKAKELSERNNELQDKLALVAKELESYRNDENGIKDMLFNAQKTARDTVQEAKEKAEVIVSDAQENAQHMMDEAKVAATAAAEEYMAQAEAKRDELEELKRQVTAFRASLLEMYKKHLECIDHIPSFRQKEPVEPPAEQPAPDADEAEQPAEPEEKPAEAQREEQPAADLPQVEEDDEDEDEPVPPQVEIQEIHSSSQAQRDREPRDRSYDRGQPQRRPQQSSLHDKVDYSREQSRPTRRYPNDELSEVGIDLKSFSDIPESLQRERSEHFSHLEFGDDVDFGRKKKRK